MEAGTMTGTTGEAVFMMLIVGVVCIGMICLKRIRESERKQEELERKRRMESIGDRNISRVTAQSREEIKKTDKNLEELKQKLLNTERELWELKEKERYEPIFQKVVMSLQVLLGLAETSFETWTEDRMNYYLWEVIADPILDAADQADGMVAGGKFLLSKPNENFDQEKVKKQIESLKPTELENYIQENEQRLKTAEAVLQKAGVVQGLGSIIEELKGFEHSGRAEKERIDGLAKKVLKILEENRIYPISAADRRLTAYPELKKRYIPLNKNSISYPGLFIKRDGMLEVFGANVGMDNCEV